MLPVPFNDVVHAIEEHRSPTPLDVLRNLGAAKETGFAAECAVKSLDPAVNSPHNHRK